MKQFFQKIMDFSRNSVSGNDTRHFVPSRFYNRFLFGLKHVENMPCKTLIYLFMSRNRLRNFCLWVLIPVMLPLTNKDQRWLSNTFIFDCKAHSKKMLPANLQLFLEFIDVHAGIFDNTCHSKGINRICTGNSNDPLPIGHCNVFSFTNNSETCLLKGLDSPLMIYAWQFRH